MYTLSNAQLGELLARRSDELAMPMKKAYRRAARLSLGWPVEAAHLLAQGEPLQNLHGIGPYLALQLQKWLENPPEVPEPDPTRQHFLTLAEAKRIVAATPGLRARGDLQMHTTWSDGSDELEDMAEMGEQLGYQYLAITDHAKTLKIAGGLDEERLQAQAEEIDRINQNRELKLLKSVEVNLNPRGEPDLGPETLEKMDIVLGCFHSKLRLKEDQTERYLAAIRNPHIHILGHPRGRIYNFRFGLIADWRAVFEEAAEKDKAVEIDCYPDRQDLDIETLELARQSHTRISLGTDAHSARQLAFMELGLAAVEKVGIPHHRVLNLMEREELLQWAARPR